MPPLYAVNSARNQFNFARCTKPLAQPFMPASMTDRELLFFSITKLSNTGPNDGRVRGKVQIQRWLWIRAETCSYAGAHLCVLRV